MPGAGRGGAGGITLQLGPNFPAARPRAVSHVHGLRRAAESAAELRRTSLQTAVAPAPAQLSLICETDATRRWCRFAVGSRCGAVRPGPRTAGPGCCWAAGGSLELRLAACCHCLPCDGGSPAQPSPAQPAPHRADCCQLQSGAAAVRSTAWTRDT